MRRKSITGFVVLAAAVAVAFPAAVGAQPPRSIFMDFAAHGRLTRHYTRAQLEVALSAILVRDGTKKAVPRRNPAVQRKLQTHVRRSTAAGTHTQLGAVAATARLPFTRVDFDLIALGGGGLLLLGGALRCVARTG